MVSIDFGDFSPINMLQPSALGDVIFGDFPMFNYLDGAFDEDEGELEILNDEDPDAADAFIYAQGTWEFDDFDVPLDTSRISAFELYDAEDFANEFATYTLIIDGLDVSFAQLHEAFRLTELPDLYAGQPLEIFGSVSFNDTLAGGNMADDIYGYGGNDVLFGNGGLDYLDGMTGSDSMHGGAGSDEYVVDSAGDVVNESAGQGFDQVFSTIAYALPAFVDDLTLLDAGGAISGTGNSLANYMEGNSFANVLLGLAGNDTLNGGAGNDSLNGGNGNDTLTGFDGNDKLSGGAGDDRLIGGNGADRLKGGDGNDTLIWHDADSSVNGGAGTDTLKLSSGSLDLLAVANTKIVDIERINMAGAGDNTLTLRLRDLLDISSTSDILRVLGEAGDRVDITANFVQLEEVMGFTRYKNGPGVLWIDSDINVV